MRFGFALALMVWAGAAPADPSAELFGTYDWTERQGRFGGFSALHLQADRFLAINDAGFAWTGRLERRHGKIRNVRDVSYARLRDIEGAPLGRFWNDAEGVAVLPNGDLAISFEQHHRIWRYSSISGAATPLPTAEAFAALQDNSGLEALASDAAGRLYAIPERSGRLDRPFPVYRLSDGHWQVPFSIPRRPPHLMVGADIGPDGRLYVLERHLSGAFGFHARVRRFDMSEDALTNEVTLVDTPAGTHYNLEGLSVWRDDQGRIRLTMISDDNFHWFMKTEFVEYIVTE